MALTNAEYLEFLWGWAQHEPHLGKFQFPHESRITMICSVAWQCGAPLSFLVSCCQGGTVLGWVQVVSARGAWVTCVPMVMPLGISALVLLWQEAKSLPLKPSSLLSPALYFSTYSSGFGIDLNREGRWGGSSGERTWGTRGRLKQSREEEEERKAGWAGREAGQAGKKGRAAKEVEQRIGEPGDKKGGSQGWGREHSFPGGQRDSSQATPPQASWRDPPSWDSSGAQHPIPGRMRQGPRPGHDPLWLCGICVGRAVPASGPPDGKPLPCPHSPAGPSA